MHSFGLLASVLASPPAAGSTVLLVDDDPQFLTDLRDLLLTYMGDVHIVTATSGPAALRLLRDTPVDLIISDNNMPEMTGLQFLAQASTDFPAVPRVMMTGYPLFDTAMSALDAARVSDVIPKPPHSERTVNLVRRLLSERRAQAA